MNIKENVKRIFEEIEEVKNHSNRNQPITLCAATKYVGPTEMEILLDNGVNHFGENRVEAFLMKYEALKNQAIVWHFIGSLQTNKVKKMINEIDYLHSLDRESLANTINKYRNEPLNCFVEVNCSQEANKHGLTPNDVVPFIHALKKFDKIKVIGLMTMAEHTADETIIRVTFKKLKDIQEAIKQLNLPYAPCEALSMGMSHDFKIAIEEGATMIRIGSRLFQ